MKSSDTAILPKNGDPATTPEPPPHPGRVDVTPLVIAELERRSKAGTEKYGTKLQTFNGRRPLVDLYQELLDAAQYIRQEIEERATAEVIMV